MFGPDARSAGVLDDVVRVDFALPGRAAVDATGGTLELPASSLDVVCLSLVGLASPPAEVARRVGLVGAGGFLHGARWGVLAPVDGDWRVGILTGGEPGATEDRIDVGRLSDRDVERWAQILDARIVRVVVFIEATPGFTGIEARFRRGLVDGSAQGPGRAAPTRPELDVASPPPAPARWYVDPVDDTMHRYWDGTAWTDHTAAR